MKVMLTIYEDVKIFLSSSCRIFCENFKFHQSLYMIKLDLEIMFVDALE